jgi:hypothetical protein
MSGTQVREPELVTVIKRLAELEARDHLGSPELHELNALRQSLAERWPHVGAALADAYMGMR